MINFRKNIKQMVAYKPPLEGRSKANYLLLDFNEMVSSPSKKVEQALKNFAESGRLQIYPEYGDLEEKIANYAEVPAEQIMVTNGGDQGIDLICRAHLAETDAVIIPSPSFAMHYQSAEIQGVKILKPAYSEKAVFPIKEVLRLIRDEKQVKLLMLCNPNNPLGSAIVIEDVEKILKEASKKGIAVLHDEAYFEFSNITAKDLINTYDNLYIIRTFSKAFGLVSIRIGYTISQAKNLQELLKIRGPYDINMFAKVAVLAALKDTTYAKNYVGEVMKQSKQRIEEFLNKKGIRFFPSSANFIFLQVPNPEQFINGLKKYGILVRPKKGPQDKPGVRVAIGTLEHTDKLIKALDKLISIWTLKRK